MLRAIAALLECIRFETAMGTDADSADVLREDVYFSNRIFDVSGNQAPPRFSLRDCGVFPERRQLMNHAAAGRAFLSCLQTSHLSPTSSMAAKATGDFDCVQSIGSAEEIVTL